MSVLPSPYVLINGTSQFPTGVNVLSGSTVTISLASSAGIYAWNVSCIGTDDEQVSSAINATLVINSANFTATFTAPIPIDGYGSAMVFQSIINNGIDIDGIYQPYLKTTFGVYILTGAIRLAAQNETIEGDVTYGWITKFNDLARALAASGSVGFSANGDLSGSAADQTVIGLYNHALVNTAPVNLAVPIYDTALSHYDIRTLTLDDLGAGFTINNFTGGSTVEIGATITNPSFSASYNVTPTSASITNSDSVDSPLTLTTPFTSGIVTGSFHHTSASTVTVTLTAIGTSTKTATSNIVFQARSFGGVGAAGATSATASGNTAILSTSDVLSNEGLHSSDIGQTYGPFAPSNQKLYLLLIGGSHILHDPSTNAVIPITAGGPTSVSFVNQNSATVTMYLYESLYLLTIPSLNVLVFS